MSALSYRRHATWLYAILHNSVLPKFLCRERTSQILTFLKLGRPECGCMGEGQDWGGQVRQARQAGLWAGLGWQRTLAGTGWLAAHCLLLAGTLPPTLTLWLPSLCPRSAWQSPLGVSNSFCNPQVSGHPQKCAPPRPSSTTTTTPCPPTNAADPISQMARSTPISRNVGRLSRSQVAAKRGLYKGEPGGARERTNGPRRRRRCDGRMDGIGGLDWTGWDWIAPMGDFGGREGGLLERAE